MPRKVETRQFEPVSWSMPEPAPGADQFPGCRPVRVGRDAIEDFDQRFEYWDADTETAWIVREEVGRAHEQPTQRLAGLTQVIAAVRGSAIECLGAMGLIRRNAQGETWRVMQADQVVYLAPDRAVLPKASGMAIGEHDRPDVVLEVDNTTDVRRGKLRLYESWGFPEVWVEVPEAASPSRPARLTPGVTIHRLDGRRYRTVAESPTFAGWTAAEIHAALNEPALSAATGLVLERVGRALGARDGTGPDDTPWLRRQRREGWTAGRAATLAVVVRRIAAERGLDAEAAAAAITDLALADLTDEAVVDAALACRTAADFRARLRPRPR